VDIYTITKAWLNDLLTEKQAINLLVNRYGWLTLPKAEKALHKEAERLTK
jgi:hypothetical protein